MKRDTSSLTLGTEPNCFLLQDRRILWYRKLPLLLFASPFRVVWCSHLRRKAHPIAVQGVDDPVLRFAASVALRVLRRHGRQAVAGVVLHHAGVHHPWWRIARSVSSLRRTLPLLRHPAAEVDAGVPALHLAGLESLDASSQPPGVACSGDVIVILYCNSLEISTNY